VGASGSGKSTFAAHHFNDEAVLSSDRFRAQATGDESDQSLNDAVFVRLHEAVDRRLEAGLLTVVDATNVHWADRARLLDLSRRHRRPVVGIVFDLPAEVCLRRNASRHRTVGAGVVRRQVTALRQGRANLELEGYAAIHVLSSESDIDMARVVVRTVEGS
jgi:predicted kinase